MAKMPDVHVNITINADDFVKALDEAKRSLEQHPIVINVQTNAPTS